MSRVCPLALTCMFMVASLWDGSSEPLIVVPVGTASPDRVMVKLLLVFCSLETASRRVADASALPLVLPLLDDDEEVLGDFASLLHPAATIPTIARLASSTPVWIRLIDGYVSRRSPTDRTQRWISAGQLGAYESGGQVGEALAQGGEDARRRRAGPGFGQQLRGQAGIQVRQAPPLGQGRHPGAEGGHRGGVAPTVQFLPVGHEVGVRAAQGGQVPPVAGGGGDVTERKVVGAEQVNVRLHAVPAHGGAGQLVPVRWCDPHSRCRGAEAQGGELGAQRVALGALGLGYRED